MTVTLLLPELMQLLGALQRLPKRERSPSPLTSETVLKSSFSVTCTPTTHRLTSLSFPTLAISRLHGDPRKSLVEKTARERQLLVRDGEITGFALRVTSIGAKSSVVREGRIKGRTCRDTLGRFPDLSVVEARAKAFEYKPGSRAAKTRTSPAIRWCTLRQTVDSHHGHYASNPLVALLRTMFTVTRLWGILKEKNPVRGIKSLRAGTNPLEPFARNTSRRRQEFKR